MGLASKLQKAGGPAGAPPGAQPGFAPSAPPAPQQQQQYGAPPSGGPTPAYPAPGAQSGIGQQGGMQGGNMQGNQSGYGNQYGQQGGQQGGQFGQQGGQYGQQGGQFGQQGGQFGQQGGQFGQQGGQFGQQNSQFGQQGGPQGAQFGQQGGQFGQQGKYGGYGGSQAAQFLQQYGQPPPYSQGYNQAQGQYLQQYGQPPQYNSQGYNQFAQPQQYIQGYNQGQGQNQMGVPQSQGQSQGQNQGQTHGILAKLQSIVQVNQLHRFYQPQQLQTLAQRIEQTVDFNALAARWGMPKELAIDLACLGLYDIVILADDSSSMSFEEGGERIEDLKLVLSKVAEVATMFDQDGILIRFLNSNVQGNGIRNAQEAESIVKQVRFQGLTPLAGSMQSHVLEPVVFSLARSGQLAKPVLVITITDGEPSDSPRDAILHVISNARRQLAPQYGPKAVAFQFAQVGRDQRAQHFLEKLDKSPEVGDMIDCTSYYELEAEEFKRKGIDMTVEIWLVKLMVGAVDPSYDAEDEG